jgi:hypothetical protein
MYAIIIAALTSIATSTDTNKRAVRERLDMVSSYVRNKQFPDHLSRRIIRYFRSLSLSRALYIVVLSCYCVCVSMCCSAVGVVRSVKNNKSFSL